METFGLPSPNPNFQACSADAVDKWGVACYTLAQGKVLCTDQCRRNFLYDASTHEVAAMPEFHRPRLDSLSLFIPSGEGKDDDNCGEGGDEGQDDVREERREDQDRRGGKGSLFLMEKILKPVTRGDIGHPTGDLEVLFYGNGNGSITSHCKLLPPPPAYDWNAPSKIGSYAVVGNGSHVCISVDGRGTYFLDTARHTWDKVGDWTLPFLGKVEYVPELKLWFGLSADDQHLAAADLSTTDSQPQLVHGWKEFQPPEEWFQLGDPQLVNLGSGRFCIARFFRNDFEDVDYAQDVSVFTGLEVLPCELNGDGKVKLEMIRHKSLCHTSIPGCRNSIHLVF
jgi:hypothetical protein